MPETDFSQLVEKTDVAPTESETPAAPVAEATATAADEQPAKVEEKKTEDPPPSDPAWNVPLQKMSQRQRTLQDTVNRQADQLKNMESLLRQQSEVISKIGEVNGVKVEPKAPEQAPAAQPSSHDQDEQRREVAQLRREVEFNKIRMEHPNTDPDKLWNQSWDEVFSEYGIDPDAGELPEGVTEGELQRQAKRVFRHKVASISSPPPPAAPTASAAKGKGTPPRTPPKTPGGANASTTPASHVPSATSRASPTAFRDECRKLVGLDES